VKRHIALAALAASGLLVASGGLLATAAAQASSTLPTVTIAMDGSTITVGGALQSGAVNVVSSVTGEKEGSPALFLLRPGVSVAEVYAFLESKAAGDPNTADRYGSIVFDTEVAQGTGETQTVLAPGLYVAIDLGHEGPNKRPHTSFTVTAAAAPAALPTPEATIDSLDFRFRGPSTLHDGELVRFENEGFLVHMDVALQVKNERAAKQVVKLLLAGREKQAEKLVLGGVGFAGPLSTGGSQQETITAKPGVYVEACFMDTQDGRSHTQLGMERIIHIAK
jgi:hypothetical protein